MDVDPNEPDLAARYARGVSDGIAAGYGMRSKYGSGRSAPPGAYLRGFEAGFRAVWKARYRRIRKLPTPPDWLMIKQWARERNVTLTGRSGKFNLPSGVA